MAFAENALQMKPGMEKNVLVYLDTIRLMVFAEPVTLIVLITEEIVSVTMDTLEMQINANHAIRAVESALDLNTINALHALMLATTLLKANVLGTHLVPQACSWMENHANHAHHIVIPVNLRIFVTLVSMGLN